MKLKHTLFILFLAAKSFAQVGINSTGAAPDPKAMLDINSTSKGFLWPRMTLAQRNAISSAPGVTPEGLTVFDTDTKNLWIWKNSAWAPYLQSPWDINGANIFNSNMGNVGINTSTPNYALQVTAKNKFGIYSTATVSGTDTVAAIYGKAIAPTPVPYSAGVKGEHNSTNYNGIGVLGIQRGAGWGVAGFIKGEGTSGVGYGAGVYGAVGQFDITGSSTGGFGVFGSNHNAGGAGGYFLDNSGTINSRALKTEGKLQFNGIGEAYGKVLTSDATGNATWQNLPSGSNVWGVNGTNIYNTNTGSVGIGTSVLTGNAKLHILDNEEAYVKIESEAANQLAGILYKNPEHEWIMGQNTGNFSDGRFNLQHKITNVPGSSTDLLTVSPTGNLGIGNFTSGLPTERLEIREGYLKVSGASKTAFIITAGGAGTTIFGNLVRFSYPGMSSTDILIVNHQYVGNYIGAIGNWYDTVNSKWTIFREDQLAMPANEKFTILVIKQ